MLSTERNAIPLPTHYPCIYLLLLASLVTTRILCPWFFSPSTYDSDRVSCSFLSPGVVLMCDRHWTRTLDTT
ncbi:hypothetical protein DFH08DRAFT_902175 [Mycena albidolilacea]|uniref:Uncharacterized protein n=1 Tax=Mycena albidolilacea TaxID=1033008 RepID=A0AAD6Z4Q1_9AGAR|nr:hypothetical protein DFH08DRAFT_902175 [Mycena albidolilacea]